MSSVMLAADSAAIEDRCPESAARMAPPVREVASLPHRIQGLAAGLLFLAARVPVYVGVLLFGALVSAVGGILYIVQAVVLRLTRPVGALGASALALLCIASPQRARADSISDVTQLTASSPMQQTTVVFSQQTNLYAFQTDAAGTLSISLKDWGFPVPLQQLTASIMSDDQVLQSWDPSSSSSWQFQLPLQSGGVFDAFIAAQAGSFYGMQLGAYSIVLSFEPTSTVPLPPAVDLLLGGMGLLGAMTLVERISRRRNRDVISIA